MKPSRMPKVMTIRSLKVISGLLLYGTVLCSHALEVEPYCHITKDHIGVNLEGNLQYKSGETLPRHVYITCSRGECEGFIRASNWLSTRTIKDLHLDYQSANMAVMRAGLSEFTLSKSSLSFTWIENPYETSGKFHVTCPEVIGAAAQQ